MPSDYKTPGFTPHPGAQSDFFNRPYKEHLMRNMFPRNQEAISETVNRESIEEKLDRIIELLEPRKSTLIVGQEAINEFKKLK